MMTVSCWLRVLVLAVLGAVLHCALAWSTTIEDIWIQSYEVVDVCDEIEGEHPVSIQAAVQFKMAGEGAAGIAIYGDPQEKQFQSFQCRGVKATIYYYEFETDTELDSRLKMIEAAMWGENGPSSMHPEAVLKIDNVLAVVSSKEPDFFERLLLHRSEFPDVSDSVVEKRLNALRCGSKKKEKTPQLCAALGDFLTGRFPEELLESPRMLFGQFWEVSERGKVSGSGFEVLYFAGSQPLEIVGAFGPIEPENAEERKQITAQIVAQAEGKVASNAAPLLEFAHQSYATTRARARILDERSLAFINHGNRAYVRETPRHLILLTKLMHDAKKQPYVVAVYPIAPDGVPSDLE